MPRPFAAPAMLAAAFLLGFALAAPAAAQPRPAPPAPLAPAEPPPAPPPAPAAVAPPPPPAPPPPQGKMPHLRLYAGGAGANQVSNGSGAAVLLGIQGYSDILPWVQTYWGTELLGVRVGTFLFPVIDGDVGARFTPFPDWLLRPYARVNLGLSLLIILPVPSAGFALGVALPIFNTVFLDFAVGVRRAFNIFDANSTLDLGILELSVGF
ncbi:MAG TPA: hypothetical protein VND93_30090 [Myxococcales bacterium]|nr:hypothetical protein [Myxococcales bacterium]